jgi:hypothetical protein
MTDYLGMEDQMAADHANAKYAEREIRRQVGQRLTEQQRAWLLKMPSWTAVRGEDILHHLDSLLNDLAATRAENQRLRDALDIAANLLIGEDYHRDPDYRQEWQTITAPLAGTPSEDTE